jgi:hypothetical protein
MHLFHADSAAKSAASRPRASLPPISPSSSSISSANNKTSFHHVLRDIPVPRALKEGIPVLRVYANGKTTKTTLRVSRDNFTIFVKPTHEKSSSKRWSFGTSSKKEDDSDRVIDVGAIYNIQRGHARRRFELARYVSYILYIGTPFVLCLLLVRVEDYEYIRTLPHACHSACFFFCISPIYIMI